MSLRLKSEVRLRVGAQRCSAALLPAGWAQQALTHSSVVGDPADPLGAALRQLLSTLDGKAAAPPSIAQILVEDELLYLASFAATLPMTAALQQAKDFFTEAMGDEPLQVGVTLTHDGCRWIAVALPVRLITDWRNVLAEFGIELQGVRAVVFDDLQLSLAQARPADDLLVLVGDEGLSLATLNKAGVQDLTWERCDTADIAAVRACVRHHLHSRAGLTTPHCTPESSPEVLLVARDARQQAALQGLKVAGWRMSAAPLLSKGIAP